MGLDGRLGLIPANDLNPQKARILLMLALTQTTEVETIARYFDMY
jgi:L-asparaginase